jgi:uncharacterized protein (TIGR03435 family)
MPKAGWLLAAGLLLPAVSLHLPASAAAQEFAVASIRPSNLQGMGPMPQMGPLVFFRRAHLKDLIALAHDLEGYQIIGGPKWIDEAWYDVHAKTETPASPGEIRTMLRTLLSERFHLQVHNGSENLSVYALTVATKGHKLKEADKDTPRDGIGAIQVGSSDVRGRGVTMHLLTRYLTIELGRPVLDETGLDGHYDFVVLFGETKPVEGTAESFGALSYAIKDLGLKVQSKKAAVPVLIVDRAEPLSPN